MWRLLAACVLLALAAAALPGADGRRAIIGDAADACRAAWRLHRPTEVRVGAFRVCWWLVRQAACQLTSSHIGSVRRHNTACHHAQGTVRCMNGELEGSAALRQAVSAVAPSADSDDWAPSVALSADFAIQHGPQQSAVCRAAKRGLTLRQTSEPGRGLLCCSGGSPACERKAAALTFYDATCVCDPSLGHTILCNRATKDVSAARCSDVFAGINSDFIESMFVWVDRVNFEQRPASVLLKFSRLRGAVRVLVFNRMYSGAVPGSFISRCVFCVVAQAGLGAAYGGLRHQFVGILMTTSAMMRSSCIAGWQMISNAWGSGPCPLITSLALFPSAWWMLSAHVVGVLRSYPRG